MKSQPKSYFPHSQIQSGVDWRLVDNECQSGFFRRITCNLMVASWRLQRLLTGSCTSSHLASRSCSHRVLRPVSIEAGQPSSCHLSTSALWQRWSGEVVFVDLLTTRQLFLFSDFAKIFGCLVGLKDEVTAITIVTFGTSMIDAFATRKAAALDPTADNTLGNVIAANSISVFLGKQLAMSLSLPDLAAASNV